MVPPGLEDALRDELTALGVTCERDTGGVTFSATPQALAVVQTWSRLAGDVRVRLGTFRAGTLEELANGVRRLPWRAVAEHGQPVTVSASSQGSKLRHREGISSKVELAVVDALRGPRLSAKPPSRTPCAVSVRIVDDKVTVSVDASGLPLHHRGWREETAKAPIRENLAAAVLAVGGWTPGTPLVDPMCGSGTFSIEAARLSAGLPPRLDRTYACAAWVPPAAWTAARSRRPTKVVTPILAADRDPGAVRATTGNAARAGVSAAVRVVHEPFETLAPPPGPPGVVVMNLPYGQRVAEGADLDAAYARWGAILRERWAGWRAVFVAADGRKLGRIDRRAEIVARFPNGGIPVVVGVVSTV